MKPRPWLRFWARIIDTYVEIFVIGLLIGLLTPDLYNSTNSKYAFTFFALFAAIFIESAFLVLFGTTLGKFLLGIKIEIFGGYRFTYFAALQRSFLVWFKGLGIGLGIITFFTMLNEYDKLKKNGLTSWDEKFKINVEHSGTSTIRLIIIFILIVFFLYSISVLMN